MTQVFASCQIKSWLKCINFDRERRGQEFIWSPEGQAGVWLCLHGAESWSFSSCTCLPQQRVWQVGPFMKPFLFVRLWRDSLGVLSKLRLNLSATANVHLDLSMNWSDFGGHCDFDLWHALEWLLFCHLSNSSFFFFSNVHLSWQHYWLCLFCVAVL